MNIPISLHFQFHKEAYLRHLRNSLDRHIMRVCGQGDDITLHVGSVSLWCVAGTEIVWKKRFIHFAV